LILSEVLAKLMSLVELYSGKRSSMPKRSMDFYLISPGEELRLPVNPPEVQIKQEKLYETVSIIRLGEVDYTPDATKIAEITFASFFPKEYDPSYCNYQPPNPLDAAQKLKIWTDSQKPVRLLITGLLDINQLVLLSATTYTVKGGFPDDIYFEISCRAWRPVKVRTTGYNYTTRTDLKPAPKVYIVKSGDCLWKIAKQNLGSSAKWPSIYNIPENKKTIGPNPDLIYPGQRLVMPV
jgi:nucleoid-associated protein YgaU